MLSPPENPPRKTPAPDATRNGGKKLEQRSQPNGPQITAQGEFGPHHATEAAAIRMAQMLLHAVLEYGVRPEIDVAPDEMPNIELQNAMREIRVSLERTEAGMSNVLADIIARNPGEKNAQLRWTIGEACADPFPPEPPACATAIEFLRRHNLTKKRWELGLDIATAAQRGESVAELLAALAALESVDSLKSTACDRAYRMAFNPEEIPPPDESCLSIGDVPIAARGNLSAIQGKSKVGKSAVVAAILGAAQRGENPATGDTLEIQWNGPATGAIIHLDTEQSRADWHALVTRSVTRSGMAGVSPRLVSLPLVMFARSERLDILRQSMKRETAAQGGVDLVVIDGIADLCASPNDEAESLELVSQVHALAQEFDAAIFCILHENPGTEFGKTRGHLGSELNRKAFANLRMDKDAEGVTTIFGDAMRKRDIPRDQGFCFAWDESAMMHTFQGRAAGLKASQAEAKAAEKAREMFAPIFEFAADSGTNSPCPALTPKEAAEAERDISGTKSMTKEATMKKRMQRAEILGVLRKSDLLRWTITQAGQAGHERDK